MSLAPGSKLGPYEILAPIGAGGMGEVYKAKDSKLDRDVAIKVLPESVAADPDTLARFEREAKAVAALSHPNILAIHDYGNQNGVAYAVMELLEGETLRDRLDHGPIPPKQAVDFTMQVARGLSAAHEKGIVHRDLKPENLFVSRDGHVKILDFGLAKRTEMKGAAETSAPTQAKGTEPGTVMGTMGYMSPEQVRGREVDHRSDIFSLGTILYELLSGKRAFKRDTASDTMAAIMRDEPPELSESGTDIPRALQELVRHCLEKKPEDRFQTARDLAFNLAQASSGVNSSQPRSVPDAATSPVTSASRRKALRIAGMGLAAAVAASLVWYLARRSGPGSRLGVIRSIAVLPLDNYSGDPGQDYFAEGMTDELTADLATISQLRVISRGSAMQFKGRQRPPTPEIARLLDVDAVVEGSVLRSGDRVRITAELVDARADKQLWAKSFERNSRDVLALQDELASAIAGEIHVQLTPNERSRLAKAPTVNPEAHDAYLKGRYFFNRPSDENLTKAIALFEEAVRLSPDFAPAYSGLSDAYLWAGYNESVLTSSEAKPKARAAAEKAIELDDHSAEAHASLANYKFFYEHDWTGCESEFRRAIALNPNYAFAHDSFGLALALLGRIDEAIVEGRRAVELDPLSPQIPLDNSIAFIFRANFSAARNLAKKSAELDPSFFFAPYVDGWIDLEAGKPAAAIASLQKAQKLGSPEFVTAFLGYAYGRSGDRSRALTALDDMKSRSPRREPLPFSSALVCLGLGDRPRAIEFLERAYTADSQFLPWMKMDRLYDPLRSEPRFKELMKKLRFDK
jgi:serine/threonine-protein kinase